MEPLNEKRLFDELAGDLQPVRPLRRSVGAALTLAAFIVTILGVALFQGLGSGILHGDVAATFVVTNGLLLVLGIAAAMATVAMANPEVGSRYDGPKWAMAAAAFLPLAALAVGLHHGDGHASLAGTAIDWHCFIHGLLYSVLIAFVLAIWLYRGAPVSPARAGLYLGVAAGALGAVAYGMSCPLQTMNHLGIWHVLPVAVAGLLGRLLVPRLLHW
ncbi:MAG: DUF1109 family protein [Novosphingobium sp.]|nr:DUF1109 family protein [Novosphingobium sp.]